MSGTNLYISLIFGFVGLAAFMYGKKQASLRDMLTGAALMGYGYFVGNTGLSLLIGILLTASLFIFR